MPTIESAWIKSTPAVEVASAGGATPQRRGTPESSDTLSPLRPPAFSPEEGQGNDGRMRRDVLITNSLMRVVQESGLANSVPTSVPTQLERQWIDERVQTVLEQHDQEIIKLKEENQKLKYAINHLVASTICEKEREMISLKHKVSLLFSRAVGALRCPRRRNPALPTLPQGGPRNEGNTALPLCDAV